MALKKLQISSGSIQLTKNTVRIKSPNATQNFLTEWGTLKHRIPQGTILQPSMFITYTGCFMALGHNCRR